MEVDLFGTKRLRREMSALSVTHAGEMAAARADLRRTKETLETMLMGMSGQEDREPSRSKTEYRGSRVKRASAWDLEELYFNDPIIFSGGNVISALCASVPYVIKATNEQDKAQIQSFLDVLRFEDFVTTWAKHQYISGMFWGEIIPFKDGKGIHSLKPLDYKTMDFETEIKGGYEYIQLDKIGMPLGYVQHPYDWSGNGPDPKDKHFKPGEIVCAPMRTVADSLKGVGIIEAIRKVTLDKLNIENALAEAIYRIGFPLYTQYVGDEKHDPSVGALKLAHNDVKKINNRSVITLPFYRKLDVLSPEIRGIRDHLDYYIECQVAGIGIAKAVVMGLGEGTNRATLEQLTDIGARNISAIHRSIASKLYLDVFQPMKKLGQLTDDAWVEFTQLNFNNKYETVRLVGEMVTAGIVSPDAELEDWIRESLELPKRTGDFSPRQAAGPPPPLGLSETERDFETFGRKIGRR